MGGEIIGNRTNEMVKSFYQRTVRMVYKWDPKDQVVVGDDLPRFPELSVLILNIKAFL